MSMKFFDEKRPHPDIELLISTNNTPLSIIPFPDTKIENYSFLELLGSERFKQIPVAVLQNDWNKILKCQK